MLFVFVCMCVKHQFTHTVLCLTFLTEDTISPCRPYLSHSPRSPPPDQKLCLSLTMIFLLTK